MFDQEVEAVFTVKVNNLHCRQQPAILYPIAETKLKNYSFP